MIVKRLVRPEPFALLTDDGYFYDWPTGGEAVDVLPQHRRMLLAAKGAHLVDVEVVDQPVILPTVVASPVTLATVPPTERAVDGDLTDVQTEPAVIAPASAPVLATVAPQATPDPVVTVRTGHRWSAEDLARLEG